MSNINELFIQEMKEWCERCEAQVVANNINGAFLSFYNFLCKMFPLREKMGIFDNGDTMIRALKNVYNFIKHEYSLEEISKINMLIIGRSYPYGYPYSYRQTLVFAEINKLANMKKKKDKWDSEKIIQNYNKFLINRELIKILKEAQEDTLKNLKNNVDK